MLPLLLRVAERAAKTCAAVGLLVLIGFAAATLVNGIARSMFSSPFDIVGDSASLLVAVAVASCFPLAVLRRANITIHLLDSAVSPSVARALRIAVDLLILVTLAATTRQLFVYAGNTARAGDSTAMLDIPTAPFWFYVAAMLAVATLVQGLLVALDVARRRTTAPAAITEAHSG